MIRLAQVLDFDLRFQGFAGKPAALLFDLDGTLVDTIDLIVASFRHVLEDLAGRPFTRQEVIALFGPTEEAIIGRFAEPAERQAACERFFSHYERHHERLVKVFPGVPELVREAAARGHPLALITNKGRRTTAITLDKSQLAACFRVVVTGDDVSRPKPHPEGIHLALERLGCDPGAAWYIGDAPVDVQAGRAAGTRTCAVLWGGVYEPERTLAASPDASCRTVGELRWLLWGEPAAAAGELTAETRGEPAGA